MRKYVKRFIFRRMQKKQNRIKNQQSQMKQKETHQDVTSAQLYNHSNFGTDVNDLEVMKSEIQDKELNKINNLELQNFKVKFPRVRYLDIKNNLIKLKDSRIHIINLCQICTLRIDDREFCRILNCMHCFHYFCIDQFFEIKKACPICEKYVYNDSVLDQSLFNQSIDVDNEKSFIDYLVHGEDFIRIQTLNEIDSFGFIKKRNRRHSLDESELEQFKFENIVGDSLLYYNKNNEKREFNLQRGNSTRVVANQYQTSLIFKEKSQLQIQENNIKEIVEHQQNHLNQKSKYSKNDKFVLKIKPSITEESLVKELEASSMSKSIATISILPINSSEQHSDFLSESNIRTKTQFPVEKGQIELATSPKSHNSSIFNSPQKLSGMNNESFVEIEKDSIDDLEKQINLNKSR